MVLTNPHPEMKEVLTVFFFNKKQLNITEKKGYGKETDKWNSFACYYAMETTTNP